MSKDLDWQELADSLGYQDERQLWHDLYHTNKYSVSTIATKLGVSSGTIVRRMKNLAITRRHRGGPNNTAKFRKKLHLMDQRVVFTTPSSELAKQLGVHYVTVYKYKLANKGEKE